MIDLATEELLGKRKNLSRFVTAECFHRGSSRPVRRMRTGLSFVWIPDRSIRE
jgi:hypothetical protein